MAKDIELKADIREETGKKSKRVRKLGLIPAVVYGRKFNPHTIAVDAKEFTKKVMRSGAGSNLIFSLKLKADGKTQSVPVITNQIQRDALTDQIIHLDFMHVIMDEAIKARVPVELMGLPYGVKEEGGVLVHGLREIEIKCLPGDIPDKFEIDVSELKINQSLQVGDLKVSDKVEILSAPKEMIANVSPPTKEEEVVPAAPTPEEAAAAAAATGEAGTAAPAAEGKEKAPAGAAATTVAPQAAAAKAPAGAKPDKAAGKEKK